MIEIEFENPHYIKCDCCGKAMTRLTRFVYQNEDAFAIYYAQFTPSHEEKITRLLIGIGEWDTEDEITMKYGFSVHIWQDAENWVCRVTDKEFCPWSNVDALGQILNREEALAHKYIKDVFHITDHIVTEDKPFMEYFSG